MTDGNLPGSGPGQLQSGPNRTVAAALTAMEAAVAATTDAGCDTSETDEMAMLLFEKSIDWGVSPVGVIAVLSRALAGSAGGIATSITAHGLTVCAITDREDLTRAIAMMRGAADIFEAVVKAGRS